MPIWAVIYGYNRGVPVPIHAPDRLLADLRPLLAGTAQREPGN